MYNLNEYAFLLGDEQRMRAYARALQTVVQPGSVVADIGAGGGVLSVLAAKAGARRVYAIEAMPLGSIVRNAAVRSGVADVVTFIEGMSTDVSLSEPVDVIVSDLHGVLPLFRQHLPSIADARRRFLRRGGVLIPSRESLHAALVSASSLYRRHVAVFDGAPYGVDTSALREMAANRWYPGGKEELVVVSASVGVAVLDYAELVDPNLDASFELTAIDGSTVHGLCVWFDSEMAPGVAFSNGPEHEETVFGRAFFPFDQAIQLRAGDRVRVRLRATLLGPDYTWTWEVDGLNTARPVRFRQSTFKGIALA